MLNRVLVLGGGSAGFLAAITLKSRLPASEVTVVRSKDIGIIGVGESTVPGVPELSNVTIRAYTDLLLHDLGEGLADRRPAFDASGSEFRTAPLWALGLVPKVNGHAAFLHDGRARSIAEAVLWHGGEAERSKRGFIGMTRVDREALIAYVESL